MSLTLVAITQPLDRQAHALGDVAGEDVAEIAGRHREGDLAMRRAERDRGGEVVDHLRHDARPVDRVDARQRTRGRGSVMVEQALHDRLAIVEGAFDRERMDVGVAASSSSCRRCTSEMRPCGNSTMRSTLSRPRNASTAAPPVSPEVATTMVVRSPRCRQHVIHQPRQELHRHVLEGERRAVEQLEHELLGRAGERHHRRMAERGVGLVAMRPRSVVGDVAADERADHLDRDFPIGPAEKPAMVSRVRAAARSGT
jgi:hypothetical protein